MWTSATGVNQRRRNLGTETIFDSAVWGRRVRKQVSDKLNSRATDCIHSSSLTSSSRHTAAGFPLSAESVNASTCSYNLTDFLAMARKWHIPEHDSVSAYVEIVLVDKDGHIIDILNALIQEGSFSDIKHDSFKDEAPIFDIIDNIVDFNDTKTKDDVPIRRCVLWDPYCHQVQGVIDRLRKRCGGHCVVVIQLCRTKAFRGEIGISNTYHATGCCRSKPERDC
ncbi:hypothetical protein OROGR_024931 [Orobanche gracilis]